MPLLSIEEISPGCRLGLWQIEASIEQMLAEDSSLKNVLKCTESYRSEARRREVIAVYALLFAMTGNSELRIDHDNLSRPIVDGYHVSISHTKGYAALILSNCSSVAVDIEYFSDRVERVAHKFIRSDEDAPSLYAKLIHWSAKETIYKLFAEEFLDYFEMRVTPFNLSDQGTINVADLKEEKNQKVCYRKNDKYVLTYAYQ